MTYKALFSSFIVLSVLIVACVEPTEPSKPKNLISEDQYIDLLVEMQHIKTWRDARPDSVNADSLKKAVFDKFDTTEDLFTESHSYYQRNTKQQIQRIEEAIHRMEQDIQFLEMHIDSVKRSERKTDSLSTK